MLLVADPRPGTQAFAADVTRISGRTALAEAFRALGQGVDPGMAQQRTYAFYRSSGPEWHVASKVVRNLASHPANDPAYEPRVPGPMVAPVKSQASQREMLAAAFKALGLGVEPAAAWRRTQAWYRCGGSEWTRTPGFRRGPSLWHVA
jgi:hypothetical protein